MLCWAVDDYARPPRAAMIPHAHPQAEKQLHRREIAIVVQ